MRRRSASLLGLTALLVGRSHADQRVLDGGDVTYTPANAWTRLTDGTHVTTSMGAKASLRFEANVIRVFGDRGPTGAIFTSALDDAPQRSASTQSSVQQTNDGILDISGMSSGNHTLVLCHMDPTPNRTFTINHFRVASISQRLGTSPTPSDPTLSDDPTSSDDPDGLAASPAFSAPAAALVVPDTAPPQSVTMQVAKPSLSSSTLLAVIISSVVGSTLLVGSVFGYVRWRRSRRTRRTAAPSKYVGKSESFFSPEFILLPDDEIPKVPEMMYRLPSPADRPLVKPWVRPGHSSIVSTSTDTSTLRPPPSSSARQSVRVW